MSAQPKKIAAEHGVVCRRHGERFGYFGWPTVARMDDGTLFVVASGLRTEHVCLFGKTVLFTSADNGRTWAAPRVIQDSMIDDRDAGVVSLGCGKVLVSWFRSDTRKYVSAEWLPAETRQSWADVFAGWTDDCVAALLGSWVMVSEDRGVTWSAPMRVPVTAPHGPVRLKDGRLLYLGKMFGTWSELCEGGIAAAESNDNGRTWQLAGAVPVYPGTAAANYHEPHLVELGSGRLLGAIRIQEHAGAPLAQSGIPSFSIMLSESADGGRSWSVPQPLGFHGSPPHLMRHSSGALVLAYGYRKQPFGQRVALSFDEGKSWEHDFVLRDDGPDEDLGYPSSVELADGSVFTVYYQKAAAGEKCSLLWSRWRLP